MTIIDGRTNQKAWRGSWEHGAPPPRPIPILHGNPGPTDDLMLTVRVVRFERPIVGYQSLILNREGSPLGKYFEYEYDRAIRECIMEVGKDSGVWLAHVTPWRWHGYSEPPVRGRVAEPDQVWAPPVSPEIYSLAKRRALQHPDTPLTVSGYDFDPARYDMA